MPSQLFVLLAFLGILPSLIAQSPAPSEPRKPLLPRTPAKASWNITFQYAGEEKPPQPDAVPRHLGEVPQSIVVTKINDISREQIQLATGKQVERWDFAGTQFHSDAVGTVFLIVPPTEENPNPEYYDRRRSDFPELSWLSMEGYRGVENFQGRPAFLFEAERGGQKLRAFLSLENQLPVMFSDGATTRLYTYNPPPAGPLTPPAAFLTAYNQHKQAMESLNYRPGPP